MRFSSPITLRLDRVCRWFLIIVTTLWGIPAVNAQEPQTTLRIAVASNLSDLFTRSVTPYFEKRTGVKLQVVTLPASVLDVTAQDVAIVPKDSVAALARTNQIKSLDPFRRYRLGCGSSGDAYVVINNNAFGLLHAASRLTSPKLPSTHEFLKEGGVAFVVVNPKVLEPKDKKQFHLLRQLNLAFVRFLPFIDDQHGDTIIRIAKGVPTIVSTAKGVSLTNYKFDSRKELLSFDVRLENRTSSSIFNLRAYLFGAPADEFINRHRQIFLVTPVNRAGPFAYYQFGSLRPGDAIVRRFEYKVGQSISKSIRIAWNSSTKKGQKRPFRMRPAQTTGLGLCSTEEPAPTPPIPDPFPGNGPVSVDGGQCFDNCCSDDGGGDCDPHSCSGSYCECLPS